MSRVYNFSAGPAVLPLEVLEQVQSELIDYNQTGMSVMELSHRSSAFESIIHQAEANLRELLDIPDNYHVLFLQGGASLQFTMAPMNLRKTDKVGYVDTGSWSTKAIKEAKSLELDVEVVASSKTADYQEIPELPAEYDDYDYLHITTNNTIEGTEFKRFDNLGDSPLVADMSSDILAKPIDVSQFGLIYAGAQKNIGPAGLTVVIVRDDLVGLNLGLPTMLDYKTHVNKNSMFNTPPTFAIYVANLVFEWLKKQGGLEAVYKHNQTKANILYNYIEESDLFKSKVAPESRSIMNIPFMTDDEDLDKEFIEAAGEAGFVNIKGHRSVGGMRASLYNAFPIEGVTALVDFMKTFAEKKGK